MPRTHDAGDGVPSRDLERRLRDSEHRFRALFEQAAVGVAMLDSATGAFLRVNRKYVEIIGYSAEQMRGLDFMSITYPEDLAEDLAAMERLRRGEIREFALEKRLLRADGTPIWVALAVSALWAPGEPPSEHVAVVQDISARKAAERRGEQARAELESTLAALPDLMFDLDDEGRIHDFRAPHPELLAAPPEVFLGRTMREVVPADVADIVERTLAEALIRGHASGARYRLEIGGVTRWFELSAARKHVDSGRPRVIAIVRDITEREVAEERRRSLEIQLRQAQKMEALGTLAGGIAHDVNNLLTVIGLSLETIRRDLAPPQQDSAPLRALDTVLARATKLVQRILAFGRKAPVSRTIVPANEAMLEATNLLRSTLPAGIALEIKLADDDLRVDADPTQLHQVLINLGTNAWQAIDRGTGTIGFELSRETIGAGHPALAPGAYARFRVRDDGSGMTADVRARIFEPFFTTKGDGQGSGLGLAVVHGIVEEHHGLITVASRPGAGTTIDVYLGAATADVAAASPAPITIRGPGAMVIYVDDEPLIVHAVVSALELLGHRARGFTRASAALAAIRAEPSAVDVVITDLSMPEMSGVELAHTITALGVDLPIVLVSGYAPQADEELTRAGIRHWLPKPFDIATLSELVRSLVT